MQAHESEPPSRFYRVAKRAGAVLAAGSVLSVLTIVFLVMRTEIDHRESTCPFEEVEITRYSKEVSIREEQRTCDQKTEERRFWMLRDDQPAQLLGGRRLPREHFMRDKYRWSISEGERGVGITIKNDGVDDATFYERPPQTRSGLLSPKAHSKPTAK